MANISAIGKIIEFLTKVLSTVNNVLEGFDKFGAVGSFGKTIASAGLMVGAFLAVRAAVNKLIKSVATAIASTGLLGKTTAATAVTSKVGFKSIAASVDSLNAKLTAVNLQGKTISFDGLISSLKTGLTSAFSPLLTLKDSLFASIKTTSFSQDIKTGTQLVEKAEQSFRGLNGTITGSIAVLSRAGQAEKFFIDTQNKGISVTKVVHDLQKRATSGLMQRADAVVVATLFQRAFNLEEKDAKKVVSFFNKELTEQEKEWIKNIGLIKLYNAETNKLDPKLVEQQFTPKSGLLGNFFKNIKLGYSQAAKGSEAFGEAAAKGSSEAASGLGGVIGKIGAFIMANIATIAIIAAVVAALAVLAYAIYKAYKATPGQQLIKNIEQQEQEITRLNEVLEETSSLISDCSSNWDTFTSKKEELENLTKGTLEWHEALNDANQAIQEIAEKLGLSYSVDTETGLYKLEDGAYENAMKAQYQKEQNTMTAISITEAQKEYNEKIKDFRDKYNFSTDDDIEKGLVDFYNGGFLSWERVSKSLNDEEAKKGSDWKNTSDAPADNTQGLEDDKYYIAVDDENGEKEWKEFSEYAKSGANVELYGAYNELEEIQKQYESKIKNIYSSVAYDNLSDDNKWAAESIVDSVVTSQITNGETIETLSKQAINDLLDEDKGENIKKYEGLSDGEIKNILDTSYKELAGSNKVEEKDLVEVAERLGDGTKYDKKTNKLEIDGVTYTVTNDEDDVDNDKNIISQDQAMQKLFNHAAGDYATEDISKTTEEVNKWLNSQGEITTENIGSFKVDKNASEAARQAEQKIVEQKQKEFMDLYKEINNDEMEEFDGETFKKLDEKEKAYFNAYSKSTSTFAKNLSKAKSSDTDAKPWNAAERKAVLEAYENISENAIQGAGQIRDIMTEAAESANDTSKAIVQAGLVALETSNYNNQAQLDQLGNTLVSDDFTEALSSAAENGEITAETINSVKDSFSDVNQIMENGVITSGGLARVMQSVNDGVLEVTDVTVGLAEAFSALSDSETAYANQKERFDNIGDSQTEYASDKLTDTFESMAELARRGAYGDSQFTEMGQAIVGEDKWNKWVTNNDGSTKAAYEQLLNEFGSSDGSDVTYFDLAKNKISEGGNENKAFSMKDGNINIDWSEMEEGLTFSENIAKQLGVSKEEAEGMATYMETFSDSAKAAAKELNKTAAFNKFKESKAEKGTNGNVLGYNLTTDEELISLAAQFDYSEDQIDQFKEDFKDELNDIITVDDLFEEGGGLSKKGKSYIDNLDKQINEWLGTDSLVLQIGTDFEIDEADFEKQINGIGAKIQAMLEKDIDPSKIANTVLSGFDDLDDTTKNKIVDKLINKGYLAQNFKDGITDGAMTSEAVIKGMDEYMGDQAAYEMNTNIAKIHVTLPVSIGDSYVATLLGLDNFTITIGGEGAQAHGAPSKPPNLNDYVPKEDSSDSDGSTETSEKKKTPDDSTVTDDPGDGDSDSGSGSGDDEDDESNRALKSEQDLVNLERQLNNLTKERQELEEGGIWTAAARIKKLNQEIKLLEKEKKIQEQILEDKKDTALDIMFKNSDKLNTDYYSIDTDERGYIVFTWTDAGQKAVNEGLIDDDTLEIYKNLQDAVNEVADQQDVVDDNAYQLDERTDEKFNIYSEWIDQGVEWTNSAIDSMGQLAQSAISMLQNVAQAALDGFNSYLGWLTIKIDDDHDIGELDESLSNIVDRLDWEYEKLLKKQIAYNGTDALNEKEVFENSNQSAKNVIARMQNQRRLYENSFRQLEDLGLNISSELTEAFESLYDRLYGADGPFTRLNKSINNFKGKLEDVLPNVTSIFGEVKGVVGNLFSKGQEKIGEMMDKLFPNSIIDDIVDSIKIDNYSLGDFGKSNMQKLIELFTELTPSFNADYQIANKAELVDALSQKMETIITNDTITSQFVKGYLDYLTEVESQMESEVSNIRSSEKEILDLYDTLTEILERGKDEYSELAQDLYDAITDEKNSLLEELQALNDNITDADSEMIEILQANLDLIRQQRDNNDKEKDLQAKEARLAYLRQDTSGANLQEILKLQDELEDEQQDYTDELIDQKISELETQNDQAADQRQVQIDLLQAEVDNTEGIWETVEELLAGISKFDKYLTGEIDRDGYKAVIEQLKKGQSYLDSSSVDKEETEKDWNSKIRAASLYRQVKDNLSEEYEYLKLAAATMDRETQLPKDYAPNEGWHNYVAFSSLEQSIDRSNDILKQAVTAINNLVEKITISYDDEQSLHMKTTYYGGVIQAVSGTEYAATKAVEDLASNAPGILTQLTTGIGNIAKGVLKSMGSGMDSGVALFENGIGLYPDVFGNGVDGGGAVTKLGDLGEAIGYFVEGMSNFAAAATDAASMGMDMIGDMAPGFADIGVAIATSLKETFFNDYERVNNELEDNIDVIIDMMGNTLGTSGYLKEIRDGIQLAKNTRMGQPDDETYPIYDVLQSSYRELMDDYKNLLARDSERTDVEGFNILYNRTLKLKEILGGFATYSEQPDYQEKLEIDPSRALEAIQKWRGEIGTLFTKIDKKVKDEIISLVNGILFTEGKTLGDKGVSRWIDIYDGIVMLDTSSTTIERVAAAMEEYEPELANKLYKLFDRQYAAENTPQESFTSFWSHKLTGIWGDVSDFFDGFWDKLKSFFSNAVENITGKSDSAISQAFDKFSTYLTEGTIGSESKSTQTWLNRIFSSITGGISSIIQKIKDLFGDNNFLGNLWNKFKDSLGHLPTISGNTSVLEGIRQKLESLFHYASGGTIRSNQRALVGEAGAELIQHARGGATYATGPSLVDLEKGDIVYNAAQTRKILSKGNLNFSRFAEGTATSMMARTAFGYSMPTVSLNLPDFDQSNKESTVNLNLNLEDLTVDTPDRVDEVAERVMDKISNTINGAMWPYNRLN